MKTILNLKYTLLILTILASANIKAQKIVETIKGIPHQLEIYNTPASYSVNDSTITLSAHGKTNLFNNPNGESKVSNAPMILFQPEGDFFLSAKVTGELKSIYDVAALVVFDNNDTWAKLCYENSVLQEPTIVSVVTRTLSDDCNSEPTGSFAYLSIQRKGNEYSFFYSQDEINWKMVRHFNLETSESAKIGFAAHGSRGDGFTAIFSDIIYIHNVHRPDFNDMRNFN